MAKEVVLWQASDQHIVTDDVYEPKDIVSKALQLRERERNQIISNLDAGYFEMASTYIWTRTMSLLKRQLGMLGNEFIGELLQRPEIDEHADLGSLVSHYEAISLALDLGIITPLQSKRMFHAQDIVSYFTGFSEDPNGPTDEAMTREEAISCLRVCVQGVLGQENITAAEDFKEFRTKLSSTTMSADDPQLDKLVRSPYFFVRTAISVLISLVKNSQGAQLEHAGRNASIVVPMLWSRLKRPERWQIGQAYAEVYNEGRKSSVTVLRSVLLKVSGFDYVPENLRSSTFVKTAMNVIQAHEGHNNFYNEPAPMKELASLGTSIPGPALATCVTAALCVRLGNRWGRSIAAQSFAKQVLDGISSDRWAHYLDGRLEEDRRILSKLTEGGEPLANWITFVGGIKVDMDLIKTPVVRNLIQASIKGDKNKVQQVAARMFSQSLGIAS
jgi:hypothetical protein